MITKKTLFILGAGASIPYGLPSGAELRNTLCHLDNGSPTAQTLIDLGLTEEREINRFTAAFRGSKQQSIDTFLASRNDFASIGKLCIAAELYQREIPEKLFNAPNDDDWFLTLWNEMQNEAAGAEDIANNSIRFVTFNYDRSLEALLHEATQNSFSGVSDELAFSIWSALPILHVYGSIGNYYWKRSNNGRPYTNEESNQANQPYVLQDAARFLKVIPEARADDPVLKEIENSIWWAEQICILGFGFDPLNMERLGLTRVFGGLKSSNLPIPSVVASTFGKTASEVRRIEAKYFNADGLSRHFIDHKNQMTLRESGIFS